jgi:hypothetical protein
VTIKQSEPLPECQLCDAPTQREAFERNGGLCSPCTRGIADTVRMVPVRGVVDLERERARRRASEALNLAPGYAADDLTAYVERYVPPVPPVPGQLELLEPPEVEP